MTRALGQLIDLLVPFGILLRNADELRPFSRWPEVIFRFLPHTFFIFWLASFVPFAGGIAYMLVLVPLSVRLDPAARGDFPTRLLLYYTVILIGFGSVWSFTGHAFMADWVATRIGWATGSPFQTELAFSTLGSGVAGLLAIWLRGDLIIALVVSKSIFWYGAAYVHIRDALVNANTAPLNIGTPLVGDILYPTLLLALLAQALRTDPSLGRRQA